MKRSSRGARRIGAALAVVAALTGSTAQAAGGAVQLLNVSYDPTRELYQEVERTAAALEEQYRLALLARDFARLDEARLRQLDRDRCLAVPGELRPETRDGNCL